MATVISFINMKGGVGKTTLAAQIAHFASFAPYRVLAVDLDPQSNLSQAILGPSAYRDLLEAGKPTVAEIFDGYRAPARKGAGPNRVRLTDLIVGKPSLYATTPIDLIPSRLELVRTLKSAADKAQRLAKALATVADKYKLIILDCPPTESVCTEAAYFASRFVVVPVKPEFLGAIGLPLLARSLDDFLNQNRDHEIEIAGIVFNQASRTNPGPEERQAIREVEKIASEYDWPVCKTRIPTSRSYAKSAREGAYIGLTSNVRRHIPQEFIQFARWLYKSVGVE